MEMFSHINELGRTGWTQLRTMVLACPRVILWSPSASYLSSFCRRDSTLPDTAELLSYIERGSVQVMAREWWLKDRKRRAVVARRWRHAVWTQGFDDVLLRLWEKDQSLGKEDITSRVRLVEEEEGQRWAEEQIAQDRYDPVELVKQARSHRELHAYAQRARRRLSDRDAAISLLRDARNHGLAFQQSYASRNLG